MSSESSGSSNQDLDYLEKITLEVEGVILKCEKKHLIQNSDYFRVLLEGNFKEKNANKIVLKFVDQKALSIIIQAISSDCCEYFFFEDEDILLVLQTSRMLQFNKIEEICIRRITELLAMHNCIRIWIITEELSVKPLYLKAKLLALDEFLELKDTENVLELTLDQLISYLGSIYLKTDTEYTVFQTIMKWWRINLSKYKDDTTSVLLKLLSCIDFKEIDVANFNEVLQQPEIISNNYITDILVCVHSLKKGEQPSNITDDIQEKATLLLNTKGRKSPGGLCILAGTLDQLELENKVKDMSPNVKLEIVLYSQQISESDDSEPYRKRRAMTTHRFGVSDLVILFYDERYPAFTKLFDIANHRCFCLDGFAIMGCKQQVFVYGGQYVIGRGEWNYNFWVWDSIRDKFEKKAHFPFPRRHFDTCRIDNTVFICGGTGVFRIFQENVFWYDYKRDVWSGEKPLPVSTDKQIKCCLFKDTLFIFSTITRCGYFFRNGEYIKWQKVEIEVESEFFKNMFAIFSYKDKLYFKGKMLIECTMEGEKMVVTSRKDIIDFDVCKIEVVLVNNIVYTYYEYSTRLALERYNIDTGEKNFIFQDLESNSIIESDKGERYVVNNKMRIFSYHHYALVEGNELVNNNDF